LPVLRKMTNGPPDSLQSLERAGRQMPAPPPLWGPTQVLCGHPLLRP
jgi:hypothetical protein